MTSSSASSASILTIAPDPESPQQIRAAALTPKLLSQAGLGFDITDDPCRFKFYGNGIDYTLICHTLNRHYDDYQLSTHGSSTFGGLYPDLLSTAFVFGCTCPPRGKDKDDLVFVLEPLSALSGVASRLYPVQASVENNPPMLELHDAAKELRKLLGLPAHASADTTGSQRVKFEEVDVGTSRILIQEPNGVYYELPIGAKVLVSRS